MNRKARTYAARADDLLDDAAAHDTDGALLVQHALVNAVLAVAMQLGDVCHGESCESCTSENLPPSAWLS